MQEKNRLFNLQFFGEGASAGDGSGDGAGTGVTTADAGQNGILESLGVPKDKAERYRARKGMSASRTEDTSENVVNDADAQPEAQDAAAAAEDKGNAARDYDAEWRTIQDDPEFNKRMQDTVNKRVSKMKGKLDGYEALAPALELIAKKYGLDGDINNLDLKALSDSIVNDTAYYEDDAIEMNTDVETAMNIHRRESEVRRKEAEFKQQEEDSKIRAHLSGLERQAMELQKTIPGFNLQREMENPAFVRMTSPGGGLTVEQAFHALHHREIEQYTKDATAKNVAKAMSNSIRSGRTMPNENGGTSRSSAPIQQIPYSQMNREQRERFKNELKGGKRF